MADTIVELAGARVLVRSADADPIADAGAALDLIGEARGQDADWVVVPLEQLGEPFLDLRTGLAGDVVQRFVNYGVRLAVLGDVTAAAAGSGALRAFVAEANRGAHLRFIRDVAELGEASGSP